MDVNELSLNGARLCLSTGASALPEEAMAFSRTVADNTSEHTYSLVGDSPTRLTFNTDGAWSFDPGVLFDSLHTGDTRIVSFNYLANDGAIEGSRNALRSTQPVARRKC